ncbi:hypothetical protein RJG79_05535 [Mycoplasmatota bacterium WC44]
MNKKKSVEIVKKRDNSIEVAIRKNPAKTTFGKVAGIVVLIGFVVLPVVALVYALVSMMSTM